MKQPESLRQKAAEEKRLKGCRRRKEGQGALGERPAMPSLQKPRINLSFAFMKMPALIAGLYWDTYPRVPQWWNGRHRRLKIFRPLAVPVQIRPAVPGQKEKPRWRSRRRGLFGFISCRAFSTCVFSRRPCLSCGKAVPSVRRCARSGKAGGAPCAPDPF